MSLRDQAIGLFIFFSILTTITVGLRIFVRTRVNRNSFGYDDVALVITYIGFLLWVSLASAAIQHPVGSSLYNKYDSAKADVCYIISGTVKISVALVLYRLDSRRIIQAILIVDILVCAIWTIVVTLILALGCSTGGYVPVPLSDSICQSTNYAQEASYVIFNVLHLIIPIAILWNVQLSRTLKWGIVALFAVGLLAAVAAIMKLVLFVKMYHDNYPTQYSFAYRTQIWAVTEHGLSLFAASILALKPVYNYLSKSWTRLSSSLSGNLASTKEDASRASSSGALSRASKRKNHWSHDTTTTEMGTIDVRNDVEVRSEDNVDQLKHPAYVVDAYNDSQRRLVVEGGKLSHEV